jgi:hypothetical protein
VPVRHDAYTIDMGMVWSHGSDGRRNTVPVCTVGEELAVVFDMDQDAPMKRGRRDAVAHWYGKLMTGHETMDPEMEMTRPEMVVFPAVEASIAALNWLAERSVGTRKAFLERLGSIVPTQDEEQSIRFGRMD